MPSATDRAPNRLARWLPIGLALVVGSAAGGCSRLKSQSRKEEPPMLGVEQVGNDSYANAHRSPADAGSGVPASEPVRSGAAPAPAPVPPPTATSASDEAGPGVALQPPVDGDVAVGARSAAASTGVPNASRLIAASGRRSEPAALGDVAQVIAQARASLDGLTSYQLQLHRQERVNGSLLPEEDVVLAIRRDPRAVRLTWPSGPHQGREVLYQANEAGGLMHVNMADSAIPVPRLSLPPDSPMVLRNSRHPITEAGFEPIIAGLEDALRRPDGGLIDGGTETVVGFEQPLHRLDRVAAQGEHWRVWIDPRTHLPGQVDCTAANGELLERYVFRDLQPNPPELATATAFDPDTRWGASRGLLGRLGGGGRPGGSTLR